MTASLKIVAITVLVSLLGIASLEASVGRDGTQAIMGQSVATKQTSQTKIASFPRWTFAAAC